MNLGLKIIVVGYTDLLEGTVAFSMEYLLGDVSYKNVLKTRGTSRFKLQGAGAKICSWWSNAAGCSVTGN